VFLAKINKASWICWSTRDKLVDCVLLKKQSLKTLLFIMVHLRICQKVKII